MKLPVTLLVAASLGWATAHADGLTDREILGEPSGLRVESLRLRYTRFDQEGHGYQSQAERATATSPGSEWLQVDQPQVELVAKQGKFTHRLWIPLDVVSAASPDALDAVSTASRTNEAGSLDLTTTYQPSKQGTVFLRAGFHLEEPFRSWFLGVGGSRSFADDNTVVAASLIQVFDWLDCFNIFGSRLGRAYRSSTNANLSLTQLLSPTTVANLSYGVTLQLGELSNTWNAVPLSTGELGREYLPNLRHRHAFVGRVVQALPWRGVLKGSYRFYVDNWGILAHTIEAQLYQRLGPWFYLRVNYRYHTQTQPPFWSINAPAADLAIRTADSDLQAFDAQTLGILAALDLKFAGRLRELHVDVGYERYFRTNDLRVNVYTCSAAFRF